jgi:murein DD-endopeptidase MepM/ murein hydrolase activator NlpD
VVGLAAAGIATAPGPGDAAPAPRITSLRCVERCAGAREAAVGATVRLIGRGLATSAAVMFPAAGGEVAAAPAGVTKRAVDVSVPEGALSGRPRLLDRAGHAAVAPSLRIVPEQALPPPGSFELGAAVARPRVAFFDARSSVRLRYRFGGYGALDVRVTLERHGQVTRSWIERRRAPFSLHSLSWDGLAEGGAAARRGSYRFRIGPVGGEPRSAARFRFHDHRFPIRGRHSYGDRFGVPRSGGRTHEGQDLWAACGTRLEAARGGSVQFRGYSASLYGHYLVIDGRQTDRDYMYAHLIRRPPVNRGARVHTGEQIGAVGKSGNARGEGCQLHFELWPSGWRRARAQDPLRQLRRWDRWS